MTSKPHIGIVGAGISGLRCATQLSQHGFRVTLLEARDRLGGRICQSEKLGYPIDLGPQWIHTSGDNPLLEVARKTETPLHSWNEHINLYDPSGSLVPNDKAVEIDELRWRLVEEAMDFSAAHENEINKEESLFDFVAKRVKEVLPDEADQALLLGMLEMWGDYIGDPVHRQSLKFAWMEEVCGGGKRVTRPHRLRLTLQRN
jgi:phytoene dehydrogenase-like protein